MRSVFPALQFDGPGRRILPSIAVSLLGLMLLAVAGCQETKPVKNALLPVNSLAEAWSLNLNLPARNDSVRGVYLRDDILFVYTQRNLVFAISAANGSALFAVPVTPDQVFLKPPILIKDKIAFPAGATIELFNKAGRQVDSLSTKRSIRSGGAPLGNTIYLGLDYPAGGRLAAIDLTRKFDRARWELMVRSGISSAPAVYQNNIYFAGEDGAITAVTEDQAPLWNLPQSAFQTEGKITADLKADESGVYAACSDTKLYCIETGTGRLRWQYYASSPLTEAPVVTADTIYQVVPGTGVVAIDKAQGKSNRDAKWIVYGATRFLSQDEKYVYLRGEHNHILICDRGTGAIIGRSARNDFAAMAINPKGSMIFAATSSGEIVGIKPITTPGTVGTLVQAPPLDLGVREN